MSLYAKYLTERTNDQILESDVGFATYRYLADNKVYIIDIFVEPECRNQDIGSRMTDTIIAEAKGRGCTEMIGTVVPSTKGSTNSLKILLAYGMTLVSASNDLIIMKKDI